MLNEPYLGPSRLPARHVAIVASTTGTGVKGRGMAIHEKTAVSAAKRAHSIRFVVLLYLLMRLL